MSLIRRIDAMCENEAFWQGKNPMMEQGVPSEVAEAGKRYDTIKYFLHENEDEAGLTLLRGLVNACDRYEGVCTKEEAQRKSFIAKGREEVKVNELGSVDRDRRLAHRALLSGFSAFQRYMREEYEDEIEEGEIPTTVVYTGRPGYSKRDTDIAIGNWGRALALYFT